MTLSITTRPSATNDAYVPHILHHIQLMQAKQAKPKPTPSLSSTTPKAKPAPRLSRRDREALADAKLAREITWEQGHAWRKRPSSTSASTTPTPPPAPRTLQELERRLG